MKNLIAYYYGIYITNYKKKDDCVSFNYNGKKYKFILYTSDVETLYSNYSIIKKSQLYCHEIIFNKNNSIVTIYNDKPYILIRENIFIDKPVDISEIINYNVLVTNNYSLNWKSLWENRVDYYEYQLSYMGFKYPILKESFDYYVGLTETAISLLNYIAEFDLSYCISHKRIYYNERLCDFFDPTNIIIDSRTRDVSEFIKSNYMNGKLKLETACEWIDKYNFSPSESIALLSRLIYPSYYFDVYDSIIKKSSDDSQIKNIIKKNSGYELFLRGIYRHLKAKNIKISIEWLEA